MTPRRVRIVVAGVLAVLAACGGDDDGENPLAAVLCPTVQAWADQTADVGGEFRMRSRGLDASARREAYEEAFEELHALQRELADRVGDLPGGDDVVEDRLARAAADVRAVFDDGAARAAQLPDEAYTVRAVREGTLFTSIEKAKAIVLQALVELDEDPDVDLPSRCGRRGALDLSPSATFPPR